MAALTVNNSFLQNVVDGRLWSIILCGLIDLNRLKKTNLNGIEHLSSYISNVSYKIGAFQKEFGTVFRMFNNYLHVRLILVLLLTTTGFVDYVHAHTSHHTKNADNFYNHPVNEFSKHSIIRPQIHHGRHKRAIISTLEEEGLHTPHITLTYEHEGRTIIADLQLNDQLIPEGHFLRYQNSKGESLVKNLTKTDVDLCHYQGIIRDNLDSRVAVSTCNGINGVVFDGDDTYFIYSGPDGKIYDVHYLFKNTDMLKNTTCGFNSNQSKNLSSNEIFSRKESEFNRILRYKRSTTDNVIRGPYNANKHSSFVELVIVVDNKVYKSFGKNLKRVYSHCQELANIVNALYVPLNIFVALVGVVVWNDANEIEISNDGDVTLKKFLQYRRDELVKNHPNDNAQLLTKEQFDGGVVGKALKGPICTFEYSGGVSMEHSQIVGVVATTVAHEMGHNFGMEHDDPECNCVDEKCIMSSSSTSVVPKHWSSCSIDQLNVAFSRGMNYCLRNKPTKLFESPQCGNGFVEAGEQCDCGLPKYCENTCCDPNTCMLHSNASCATGECCDLNTCRPKTAGTECRSAEGECDLPEFCTGESEYCPTDVFKRDTELCDGGNAFCYEGTCRSRSSQCKILWGPSGESSEHCYEKNTNGSRHGNCGFNRLINQYLRCREEDVLCGMLHCRHLNERLEFGMESVAVLSHSFMNYDDRIIPCRTAIVDLGLQAKDPGLTPNGARCGDNSMCVDQKCIAIEKLRANGLGIECPENCNGNGVCNSKGHCHCIVGFGPPYCSSHGPGGSEDSGPATNPNSRVGFTRAMYIFFLGVVPAVSAFLFFMYYWKQNKPFNTRKSPSVVKNAIKINQSRGPPTTPGLPTSTPSSTDDMNSALLRSPTEDTSVLNNSMFGKFKGFTLRPLPNAAGAKNLGAPNVAFVHPVTKSPEEIQVPNGIPQRSAPPVPKYPPVIDKNMINDILKQNGTIGWKQSLTTPNNLNQTNAAPALPPPNPGFNARPIISSPVLEASTCTAKELMSPLKSSGVSIPVRTAPTTPPVPPHADPKLNTNISNDKKGKDGTIKRIASFLKKDDKSDLIQSKYPPKVKPMIDREKLRNIEISAPIPVVDQMSDSEQLDERHQVTRTQSMRDPDTNNKKPNIQSFGSMRQQSNPNRPKSIVGVRPKSPPPRPPAPPAITNLKIPGVPGYQNPPEPKPVVQNIQQNEYDDCEAVEAPLAHISEESSPTGSDNIYSVIDERPMDDTLLPPPLDLISSSNDSMGLLGEIVDEIEKRNGDSIYTASTLKRNKNLNNDSPYLHTNNADYSEDDYLKSTESTTSSGYLRPSAINAPVARVAPTRPDLPPTTTAVFSPPANTPTTTSSNISASTTNVSSFKPKTATHAFSKLEQKPSTNATRTAPIHTHGSKAKTSSNPSTVNKSNISDSVRKRSPSPNGIGSKTATNAHIRNKSFTNAKSSANLAQKSSSNDVRHLSNPADTTKKTAGTGNASQKPKPLLKPTTLGNKASSTSSGGSSSTPSSVESRFGRQNVPSDASKGIVNGSASGSSVSSNSNLVYKRTRPSDITMTNSKVNNNSSSNQFNSSINTSSSNKILSAVARPTPGKLSNVASLQQKFESAAAASGKPTTGSNSLAGNSLLSVKK